MLAYAQVFDHARDVAPDGGAGGDGHGADGIDHDDHGTDAENDGHEGWEPIFALSRKGEFEEEIPCAEECFPELDSSVDEIWVLNFGVGRGDEEVVEITGRA